MRDVLRLVPLIGYYVEFQAADEIWVGVVDAVTHGADGARVWFADGCIVPVDIAEPDDWIISVYRRAPNAQ